MKIHSIVDVIIVPFVILLVYMGYQAFTQPGYPYLVWILAPIIVVILLYLFKPQIDFQWHKKFPAKLDKKLQTIIERFHPIYKNMEGAEKEKFENRLALYMEARAFKAVGSEHKDVPYDIKGILATIPVLLTMNKKDFLIGDIDRVFLYKHPFPTPRFQFLHNVETHIEDGVIIMSLEMIRHALDQPKGYFNIAWYGFVDAYLKVYKDDTTPLDTYATWEVIEKVSGFNEEHILQMTGLKSLDPLVVITSLFYTHREEMNTKEPELHSRMLQFFGQKA